MISWPGASLGLLIGKLVLSPVLIVFCRFGHDTGSLLLAGCFVPQLVSHMEKQLESRMQKDSWSFQLGMSFHLYNINY